MIRWNLRLFSLVSVSLAATASAIASDTLVQPEDGAPVIDSETVQSDDANKAFLDRWMSGWEGSVEFGLNGSSGNTDKLDMFGLANATRDTDETTTTAALIYQYGKTEGDLTDNNFFGALRNDWKIDGDWSYYIEGTYEYDDFQNWQHRITFGPGVGYKAVDTDTTQLNLRAGVQLKKEFGSSDNTWTPEGVLGFDLSHQLTERQELGWKFDLYPELDEFGPYRFITDAFWKINVDPETNLFFRVGVRDEYDSSPGAGVKRSDFDYYATLGWTF